jgi:hypothetical protein
MPTTLVRPLTTLREVQKETRNVDTAQEDWFKECINAASRAVEAITGREFWYFDYSSTELVVKEKWVVMSRIYLPWPIITLTEIKNLGEVVPSEQYYYSGGVIQGLRWWATYRNRPNYSNTGLDGTPIGGDHESEGLFAVGSTGLMSNPLTIKGTFGWPLTDAVTPPPTLPADLRRAATLLAAAWTMFNRRELVGYDGQKQTLLDSRIPKEVKDILSAGYSERFL